MTRPESHTTASLTNIQMRDVLACRIAELVNGMGLGEFNPLTASREQLQRYYAAADYAISMAPIVSQPDE